MKKFTQEEINTAMNKAYFKAGHNAFFGEGFQAGIDFVQTQEQGQTLPIDVVVEQSEQLVCKNCGSTHTYKPDEDSVTCYSCGHYGAK